MVECVVVVGLGDTSIEICLVPWGTTSTYRTYAIGWVPPSGKLTYNPTWVIRTGGIIVSYPLMIESFDNIFIVYTMKDFSDGDFLEYMLT